MFTVYDLHFGTAESYITAIDVSEIITGCLHILPSGRTIFDPIMFYHTTPIILYISCCFRRPFTFVISNTYPVITLFLEASCVG